jgi:UDP-3-O-[3-hydroxymyristoyl] N-acetylglucosamine deacetylase
VTQQINAAVVCRAAWLTSPVELVGRNPRTGELCSAVLQPGRPGSGIVFEVAGVDIPAHIAFLTESPARYVSLSRQGQRVDAVEHLLGALVLCGIEDARVACADGAVPSLQDTSANGYVQALEAALSWRSIAATPRATDSIVFQVGLSRAELQLGGAALEIDLSISFPDPIGHRSVSVKLHPGRSHGGLAEARSFLRSPADQVWADGRTSWERLTSVRPDLHPDPSKGELVTFDTVGWRSPPNSPDEFCLHKALDLVADLSLSGLPTPLTGRVVAERPGHRFNHALARHLANGRIA